MKYQLDMRSEYFRKKKCLIIFESVLYVLSKFKVKIHIRASLPFLALLQILFFLPQLPIADLLGTWKSVCEFVSEYSLVTYSRLYRSLCRCVRRSVGHAVEIFAEKHLIREDGLTAANIIWVTLYHLIFISSLLLLPLLLLLSVLLVSSPSLPQRRSLIDASDPWRRSDCCRRRRLGLTSSPPRGQDKMGRDFGSLEQSRPLEKVVLEARSSSSV